MFDSRPTSRVCALIMLGLVAPLLFLALMWGASTSSPDAPAGSAADANDGSYPTAASSSAWTDRGRPIKLVARPLMPPPGEAIRAAEAQLAEEFPEAVTSAPADATYSCHGWIFAAGNYWIAAEMVDLILEDNGYHPVADPRPDDLVIYRDASGRAVHSGLVREPSGRVVVESKWGGMHRVVHPIDTQPFSKEWVFYRTDRPGHLLRVSESGVCGHCTPAN